MKDKTQILEIIQGALFDMGYIQNKNEVSLKTDLKKDLRINSLGRIVLQNSLASRLNVYAHVLVEEDIKSVQNLVDKAYDAQFNALIEKNAKP